MIDQSPSQDELNTALELMFHGYRALTASPDALLARYDWNRVHHRILYFVARRSAGISQQDLLATLGVSKQALHGPLRQLLAAGLIDSLPAEHDKRLRMLRLTAAGIDLEQQLSNPQRELLAAVFQSVGESATVSWLETMRALCRAGEAQKSAQDLPGF
ncbi:MarR family winged helix-turn-helix transcriptional regulator [Chitinilyticum litopenaei]|uniref:MarR family winged helix-turn-helix transcriptional regulator n=1 Tax=Chitinilyticum litopenaei TaxID=1121276 RepID=UPI0003F976EE|nr:MarR family transcriptional regulator [Chitinilyticum litopenaei]